MKTVEQASITIADTLNAQLLTLATASEQEVASIFTQAIKDAFASVAAAQHQQLYKVLSRQMHEDKLTQNYYAAPDFMKELQRRGFVSLPMTMLTTVWREISLNVPEPPKTYNPFAYTAEVIEKLSHSPQKMILLQKADPELGELQAMERALKEQFPGLYKYEQYSQTIKNIMYWTAVGVNSAIALSLISMVIAKLLPGAIKVYLERPLLNYATENRYGQQAALILYIKLLLPQNSMYTTNLTDNEWEYAFQELLQTTAQSHRNILQQRGVALEELTDDAITLLFKKVWIVSTIKDWTKCSPKLLENMIVSNACLKLREVNAANNEAVKSAFKDTTDDAVNEIYMLLRKAQQDQISVQIEQIRAQVYYPGLVHLNMVFSALQDTWMADVPVMKRIMQALAILFALPLMATGFLWDAFDLLFMTTMVLLKTASVWLINAPLDIHAYFTATSPAAANDYEVVKRPWVDNGIFSPRTNKKPVVAEEVLVQTYARSLEID